MDNNQQMNQGQGYNPQAQQAYQQVPNQQMYQQQAYQQVPNQQMYQQQAYQQMPNQQMYQQAAPKVKKPMSKGAKLGLILGLSIGIPVLALILILCLIPKRGASSPEKAAEGFMKAWLNNDVKKMKKYSMPSKMESALKYQTYSTVDSLYYNEYYNNYNNTTSVMSVYSTVDEYYDYSDISDINSDLARINVYLNIKEARCMNVNYSYMRNFSSYDDHRYLDVIKVGGKWYVIPERVLDNYGYSSWWW